MNNLFILHTQYNLILGSGIALSMPKDKNHLVLYAEFPVSEEILSRLETVFCEVTVVRDRFAPEKTRMAEIKEIRAYLKKTKHLKKVSFDRIFLAQERRFDTLLAYRCSNKNSVFIDVEEDAYYAIRPERKAPKKTLKTALFDVARRLLCGKNPHFTYDIPCYGSNAMYKEAYLLFPTVARDELKSKTLKEMTPTMIYDGIDALYGKEKGAYPEGEKYLLLFFDLSDRYRDKEKVLSLTRRLIEEARAKGYIVLAKYHPRETEKFTDIEGLFEVNQVTPGEKILSDLKDKSVTVFGNATTVCTVAAKLGQRVVSIAKIDHPQNAQMHEAMKKMGIALIESENEVSNVLN